jgi:hypothetical protein
MSTETYPADETAYLTRDGQDAGAVTVRYSLGPVGPGSDIHLYKVTLADGSRETVWSTDLRRTA